MAFRNVSNVSSELRSNLKKATTNNMSILKPTQIQKIFEATEGDFTNGNRVAEFLLQKIKKSITAKKKWKIVLKSLIVLHKGMQYNHDEDSTFLNCLVEQPSHCWNLSSYLDKSTTETWTKSKFCGKYAKYLFKKTNTFSELGVVNRISDEFKEMKPSKIVNVLKVLNSELGGLALCVSEQDSSDVDPLSTYAMVIMSKDVHNITSIMSAGMYVMMDHIVKLRKETCRKFLSMLDSYIDNLEDIDKLRKCLRAIGRKEASNLIPSPKEREKTQALIRKVKDCVKEGKKAIRTDRSSSVDGNEEKEEIETLSLNAFLDTEDCKRIEEKKEMKSKRSSKRSSAMTWNIFSEEQNGVGKSESEFNPRANMTTSSTQMPTKKSQIDNIMSLYNSPTATASAPATPYPSFPYPYPTATQNHSLTPQPAQNNFQFSQYAPRSQYDTSIFGVVPRAQNIKQPTGGIQSSSKQKVTNGGSLSASKEKSSPPTTDFLMSALFE